jgi:hypothetical protein
MMIQLQALRDHEIKSKRNEIIKEADLGPDIVYASAGDGEREGDTNRAGDRHAARMAARERFRTKRGLTPRVLDPLDSLPGKRSGNPTLSPLKTRLVSQMPHLRSAHAGPPQPLTAG